MLILYGSILLLIGAVAGVLTSLKYYKSIIQSLNNVIDRRGRIIASYIEKNRLLKEQLKQARWKNRRNWSKD